MLSRGYSENAGNKEQESNSGSTASNFVWMAGTGGFFGALIYYLGKPEINETSDTLDSVNTVKIKENDVTNLLFSLLWVILRGLGTE